MKSGKYYIGDLCYVLSDRWDEVCDQIIFERECKDGEFHLPKEPKIAFASYGTAHGDGGYYDQNEKEYAVDSGTIGCVSIEYLDETILKDVASRELGHIHIFEQDFKTSSNDGILVFGDICIDTDPSYEEEWDDGYGSEEDEEEEESPG